MSVRRLLLIASALALSAFAQCKAGVASEAQPASPTAAQHDGFAAPSVTPAAEQRDGLALPQDPQSGPRVVLEPPGAASVSVRVELAQTPEQRQRGLMYRTQLAPDAGMLFFFERPAHNVFWMRNTYLPLDMIFITTDWTILGIVENATPRTDSPREVPGESLYVLEVNAGFSRQHGLVPGTKLRLMHDGP